jgi:hypothetical protein
VRGGEEDEIFYFFHVIFSRYASFLNRMMEM